MEKRLLQKDYDSIVQGTFTIPESDFYKYYSNVVEEHHPKNDDIFQELINAIERKIEWYRSRVDNGPTWGGDEEGNKTLLDPELMSVSLLPDYGIKRHVNRSFFDEQIMTIEGIRLIYKGKKILKEHDENMDDREILSARFFFASFPDTEEDILKFHLRQFERFKFNNSSIATIDGKKITDLERGLILNNSVPIEGIVEVQGEPDEALFIDKMIQIIERDRLDLPGKIMVKADRYLKFLKNRRSIKKTAPTITKACKSIVRARAFCILLMQENGKIDFYNVKESYFRKKELIKYIEGLWKDQSGQTVYEFFVKAFYQPDKTKEAYREEFEYGRKLYYELPIH